MRLLHRRGFFRPSRLGLQVGRATSPADLADAYRLVHAAYVRCGYMVPHDSGLRVRAHEAVAETATFVAKDNGPVVGVTSVIQDSPALGLPADEAFGEALDALRREGRKVCEGSNWVLARPYRNSPVMTELLRCCLAHAVVMGCDDFVGAISPGHVSFYELLGFEVIGGMRSYSREIDDPVVLVRLALDRLGRRLARADLGAAIPDDEALLLRYYLAENPYFTRIRAWEAAARKHFTACAFLQELLREQADLTADRAAREADALQRTWRRQAS